MVGQMKRCRPALEGQSNSNLMDPLALDRIASSQEHAWTALAKVGSLHGSGQTRAN